MKRLVAAVLQLFHLAGGLLEPAADSCLVCSKPHRSSSNIMRGLAGNRSQLGKLCSSCILSIQWTEGAFGKPGCRRCGGRSACTDCKERITVMASMKLQPRAMPNLTEAAPLGSPLLRLQQREQRVHLCNRSAVYYTPTMREWLARYKYRGDERLAPLLAEQLLAPLEQLTAELEQASAPINHTISARVRRLQGCWDAICYVPMSRGRSLERGFNQAEQLAGWLCSYGKLPLFHLLNRSGDSGKQSQKTRQQRLDPANKGFTINESELTRLLTTAQLLSPVTDLTTSKRSGLRILIIDDVYTTGSTVESCAQVLWRHCCIRECQARIYSLTWARA